MDFQYSSHIELIAYLQYDGTNTIIVVWKSLRGNPIKLCGLFNKTKIGFILDDKK
jgi:hypothetical protein